MGKKSVLSTLRFIFFTIIVLVLTFSAVMITVLNMYKPTVKAFIEGKFIGYFSSEQQFDEVYNDLVTEKRNMDQNVKVYLSSEPTFEKCYIRDSVLSDQNIYTSLRAEVKAEFTMYEVAVNGENKMTFTSKDEANKYSENLKKEVAKLNIEIKEEKVAELKEVTSIERAENILKDIVDRNKPVEIPKAVVVAKATTTTKTTSTNATASAAVANAASAQGGVWPTAVRYVSSPYGWRSGSFHTGTDIAGPAGTPIYSYKSGLVTFAGWQTSYGNIIKVDHGNGLSTWYAHCSSFTVSAGTQVSQGQVIAKMGSTGWSTGNHLHFEVRINGVHTNSYNYIAGK